MHNRTLNLVNSPWRSAWISLVQQIEPHWSMTMKAAYQTKYGSPDVLAIRDVPRPQIAPDEVLVQVHASTVNTADWRIRASAFPTFSWLPARIIFGLFRPKTHTGGMEFSGRIVAKGAEVKDLKGGDGVLGW